MRRIKMMFVLAMIAWLMSHASARAPVEVRLLLMDNLNNIQTQFEQLVTEHLPHVHLTTTAYDGGNTDLDDALRHGAYDVIAGNNVHQLHEHLMPLDPFIRRVGLNHPLLDARRIAGVLYDIPLSLNTPVIMYNKEWFDRAELPYPQAGWLWDDLLFMIEHLHHIADGALSYGIVLPSHLGQLWATVLHQSGQSPLYADVQALDRSLFIMERLLLARPHFYTHGFSFLTFVFQRQNAALKWDFLDAALMQLRNDMSQNDFHLPFRWGLAALPAWPNRQPTVQLHADLSTVGISATTRDPASAWEVAQLLATEAAYLTGWTKGPPLFDLSEASLNRWLEQTLPFIENETQTALHALFRLPAVYPELSSDPTEEQFIRFVGAHLDDIAQNKKSLADVLEAVRQEHEVMLKHPP